MFSSFLFTVIIASCDDELKYWGCFQADICYYSSYYLMSQSDAEQFCERHNMDAGLSSVEHYVDMIRVPYAGNYTWIGLKRYPQDKWKLISGQDAPFTVNSENQGK